MAINKTKGKSTPIYLYEDQLEKLEREVQESTERNASLSSVVQKIIDSYFNNKG